MELLVASAIGILTAVGIYLMLRGRSFPIILGITFLSYAVNLFLFSMGRLAINSPAVYSPDANGYADPVPQALVLTAIVISFGMSALIVVMALRGYLETGSDHTRLSAMEDDTGQSTSPADTPPNPRDGERA
ncbi:Na+/H+ antiporter subunit C [Xanthobacter sp. TB0136]|uniref:Na+/H+ antiporter subunit C n=1 Tax=Xanthobacter sp. TB0136 TaxID=3459177 RepID=UPI00403A0D4A